MPQELLDERDGRWNDRQPVAPASLHEGPVYLLERAADDRLFGGRQIARLACYRVRFTRQTFDDPVDQPALDVPGNRVGVVNTDRARILGRR